MFSCCRKFYGQCAKIALKVGTNPTMISPSAVFEIESRSGNKIKVDKTTGKLTLADGTQGAGKILGSDANGLASWKTPSVIVGGVGYGLGYSVPNSTSVCWSNAPVNSYPYIGPTLTIAEDGLYQFTGNIVISLTNGEAAYVVFYDIGNNAGYYIFALDVIANSNSLIGPSILYIKAGTYQLRVYTFNAISTGCMNGVNFGIQKVTF